MRDVFVAFEDAAGERVIQDLWPGANVLSSNVVDNALLLRDTPVGLDNVVIGLNNDCCCLLD